jgi:hypothetical protein
MAFRHRRSKPEGGQAPPPAPRSAFATGDEVARLRDRVTRLEEAFERQGQIIINLQLKLEQLKNPAPENNYRESD